MSADSAAPSPSPSRAPKGKPRRPAPNPRDEAQQVLAGTGDSLLQIASECAAICRDDLAATLEAGTKNASLFAEISQSCLDACMADSQTLGEIARDALTCRTAADLLDVQTRALERVSASVERSSRLWAGFFEIWCASADPLVARLGETPQRLFRAVAD